MAVTKLRKMGIFKWVSDPFHQIQTPWHASLSINCSSNHYWGLLVFPILGSWSLVIVPCGLALHT
ncbi:hypothetical protein K469DRAFT_715260 [Zopfia rhizophila CBS 207.26]|uniref:Uncharacterized protein n=1 Tax=Zopfia rhizophila CBS 207.26 TaxID=1314779 RepID=A0A6A6ET01_9PEZI|nr:hypothetical protein K469DRAFT_715260 [Zopfia rhizophila CBS 207.26]